MDKEELIRQVDLCLSDGNKTNKFLGCSEIGNETWLAYKLLSKHFKEQNVKVVLNDEIWTVDMLIDGFLIYSICEDDFKKWRSQISINDICKFIDSLKGNEKFIEDLKEYITVDMNVMHGFYWNLKFHFETWTFPKSRYGEIYMSMSRDMNNISIMYDGDCIKITREEVLEWIK